MRTLLYIVTLIIIMAFGWTANAGSSKDMLTRLSELDTLMSISQDLNEDTKIYISVSKDDDKSCFCACRYPNWVCTNAEGCQKHNQECSNQDDRKSSRHKISDS